MMKMDEKMDNVNILQLSVLMMKLFISLIIIIVFPSPLSSF